ncbi:nmra-like family protein, partial [Colletotrichum incanum]
LSQIGIEFVRADYRDVASLVEPLESRKEGNIEETERSQIGLVEASKQCVNTKRFMPSQYDPINTPEAAQALRDSELEYTRFVNGFLMDYWGIPYVKSYMPLFTCHLTSPIAKLVTYSIDLAQFIAWALEVKDWSRFSIVIGTDLTPNEALAKIERVRGKNFEFAYDSEEALSQNKATSLGSPRAMIYEPVEEYSMIG